MTGAAAGPSGGDAEIEDPNRPEAIEDAAPTEDGSDGATEDPDDGRDCASGAGCRKPGRVGLAGSA